MQPYRKQQDVSHISCYAIIDRSDKNKMTDIVKEEEGKV